MGPTSLETLMGVSVSFTRNGDNWLISASSELIDGYFLLIPLTDSILTLGDYIDIELKCNDAVLYYLINRLKHCG
jgi:hypothetical protein